MRKNAGLFAFVSAILLISVSIPVFASVGLGLAPGASGNASGNASGEPVEIMLGDLDGKEGISSEDARLALRMAVKLEKPNAKQAIAADVDRNGKIEAADARLILRVAVKLEPDFSTVSVVPGN